MISTSRIVLVSAFLLATPALAREPDGVPIGKGKQAPIVRIISPRGGWTVDRMMLVSGVVSDSTIDPVVLSINGDRYLLRARKGAFSRKFPAASGRNVVTVMATNRGGTGTAQATTYVQVPPVPLKVILTSDTDGVWTDLHIYEPTPEAGGKETLTLKDFAHVYWANTESPSGGTFYLNEQGGGENEGGDFDQPGYGPYLYVHRAPPKGVFLIATNYWPSGDQAHTVATLNIAMFEGTPNEIKRTVHCALATQGTTRVLAWINVVDGSHALVYVPGQDPAPSGNGWPKNLSEIAQKLQSSPNLESTGE